MSRTQKDRVLETLKAVGIRGVTQVDFIRYPTADGGPPITRLAARIDELKQDGHVIATRGTRDKCVVYTLVATPEALEPIHKGDQEGQLFAVPSPAPRNALDDDWAA